MEIRWIYIPETKKWSVASSSPKHRHEARQEIRAKKPDGFLERKKYDSSQRYKLSEEERLRIVEYVSINKQATLQEIVDELALPVSRTTLSRFLRASDIKLFPNPKKQPERLENESANDKNVQMNQL